jgi:hypothetical protein
VLDDLLADLVVGLTRANVDDHCKAKAVYLAIIRYELILQKLYLSFESDPFCFLLPK